MCEERVQLSEIQWGKAEEENKPTNRKAALVKQKITITIINRKGKSMQTTN